MEILRERRRIRDNIIKEATEWAKTLRFKATIILIGSYARGDFNKWSDIDILLIANLKGNPIQRLKKIDHSPGYQIIPLTPKEFQKIYHKNNPIAREAIKNGIILRQDINIKNLIKNQNTQ